MFGDESSGDTSSIWRALAAWSKSCTAFGLTDCVLESPMISIMRAWPRRRHRHRPFHVPSIECQDGEDSLISGIWVFCCPQGCLSCGRDIQSCSSSSWNARVPPGMRRQRPKLQMTRLLSQRAAWPSLPHKDRCCSNILKHQFLERLRLRRSFLAGVFHLATEGVHGWSGVSNQTGITVAGAPLPFPSRRSQYIRKIFRPLTVAEQKPTFVGTPAVSYRTSYFFL